MQATPPSPADVRARIARLRPKCSEVAYTPLRERARRITGRDYSEVRISKVLTEKETSQPILDALSDALDEIEAEVRSSERETPQKSPRVADTTGG